MRAAMALWMLAAVGCGAPHQDDPTPGGADDGADSADGADGADGEDGTDGTDGADGTDGTDPDVTVGGFAFSGDARDWPDAAVVSGGCVAWMDVTDQASGGQPVVSAAAEVDAGGAWRLEDIPRGSTLGLFVVFDDCAELEAGLPADSEAGRAGAWAATAVHVPAERWAHLGPEDTLDGLTARALSQEARAAMEAEHAEARAWDDTEAGLMFGRVLDDDLQPMLNGRVRGPSGTQVMYQQSPGVWLPWESTTPEGDGLYAVNAPVWSSWICFSPAGIYDPILAGGVPHLMLYRDCVPVVPR